MAQSTTFFPFARDQISGAIVVNVFAILSAVALVSVTLRILWLAVIRAVRPDEAESKEYIFFHSQLGYYAACLLIGNMFNSIAGLMGLPALVRGGIFQDGYCTAQGVIMQFGNLSTAYFTLTIGIHTFNSLVLRKRQSVVVYSVAIVIGWIFAGVLAVVPFFLAKTNGEYYGMSGLSCGLRSAYPKTQFLLHLLPIFLTAIGSAILYSLIFLVLRGTLVIKGGFRLQLNPGERWNVRLDGYHKFVAGIAKSMIWYPAAYIALLVPYSVTRLFAVSGFQIPFQAVVFAFTCWFLLGVVNVLLLYNTLRVLSPAFDGRTSGKDPEGSGAQDQDKRGYNESRLRMQEKSSDQFAFPTFSPISPTTNISAYGSERGLLTYPERAVSISSYYNYPISSPSIGSNISPPSALNQNLLLIPEPKAIGNPSPPQSVMEHSRENSADSLLSLPAPPRRTRSPPRGEPIVEPYRSPANNLVVVLPQTANPTSPISARSAASPSGVKRETSVRARASDISDKTASSSDLDISGWLARQNPDGSMPRGLKSQPLLSAVTPAFPSLPTTTSPVKQSGGPRPLVPSDGGAISPGTSDLGSERSPVSSNASSRFFI